MMTPRPGIGIALQNYVAPGESISAMELVRLAQRAEELGFTSAWVWDHLFLGSKNVFPVHESLSILTGVAATTKKIRLSTGVLVLPLRNPVELAKRVATLDNLSEGRVTLGVAAGWYEREFEATGSDFHSRGRNLETYVKIMRRLWTETRMNATYGPYRLNNVTMEPRPTQKPCPPVWMGGYTEKAHARLGRLADGWISYFYTPEAFATNWRRILDATESAGRDAFGMANCNMIPARLDNDRDHAALTLKQFVTKYCDLPAWSQATVESGLSGPSRDVVGGIEAQRAAGVQEVVLVPAVTSLAEIREQIEAMGRDVLPSFV